MATLLAPPLVLRPPHGGDAGGRGRIAILLYDLSATGVTRNALMISAHLAETFDVTLLVVSAEGVLAPLVDSRVALVPLTDARKKPGLRHLAAAAWRLRADVRTEAPDVVLSAGNRTHLVASLAGVRKQGAAMIFRLSNSVAHAGGARGLKGLAGRLGRAVSLRLVTASASELLAVSPSVAREVTAWGKSVRTIRNGVDGAAVRTKARAPLPAHVDLPTHLPWALSVGRLVEQKNHEAAIDALAVANRTTPMALVILGDGSDRAKAALHARAHALGVADRLHIMPPVDNPFPILRRASVFLMLSRWEGCSNALLEAMACGLPIVASDRAGDAANLLGFGKHGLLVDAANPEDVAAALEIQLSDNPVLPGARAEAFDVRITLRDYTSLMLRNARTAGRPQSRALSVA